MKLQGKAMCEYAQCMHLCLRYARGQSRVLDRTHPNPSNPNKPPTQTQYLPPILISLRNLTQW